MRRLSDFIGTWELEREIRHADGTAAVFRGVATWTARTRSALYEECGTLDIAGQGRFSAQRRYLWDDGLNVCFEDGRLFHTVPPAGGKTHHFCAPDQYDGLYDFSCWPVWYATWRVSGPRKAYEMTSVYKPTPA